MQATLVMIAQTKRSVRIMNTIKRWNSMEGVFIDIDQDGNCGVGCMANDHVVAFSWKYMDEKSKKEIVAELSKHIETQQSNTVFSSQTVPIRDYVHKGRPRKGKTKNTMASFGEEQVGDEAV
jgi:predicted Fe-S protein YdhL (DUF1289 family)